MTIKTLRWILTPVISVRFVAICRSAGCSIETILDAMGLKGVGYEQPIKTPYHVRKGVKVHAPAYLSGDDLIIPLVDIRGNKKRRSNDMAGTKSY